MLFLFEPGGGMSYLMTVSFDMLCFALLFSAVSYVLIRQWKVKAISLKKESYRKNARCLLMEYKSRNDHPEYEFSGKDTTVVLTKEEFRPRNGQLAGTFIYLCRNAFGEYFFCVIDVSLSAIHIPKERALLFLKDFPEEYAAELHFLAGLDACMPREN